LSPTLVLHGDSDAVVPVTNAREVERWVKGLGAPVTVHVYPGQKHGFTGAALADSVERAASFMREHVH
jgi:dipeptidyl aminopeptidase/acylaminoacyl peptidase